MKQYINEIKRMQQLAGIISESENIDELFGFGGGDKDTKGSVNVIALGWNFKAGAKAYLSKASYKGKIVCYPDTPDGDKYAKAWLKAIENGKREFPQQKIITTQTGNVESRLDDGMPTLEKKKYDPNTMIVYKPGKLPNYDGPNYTEKPLSAEQVTSGKF
jgi:hypothetical protein